MGLYPLNFRWSHDQWCGGSVSKFFSFVTVVCCVGWRRSTASWHQHLHAFGLLTKGPFGSQVVQTCSAFEDKKIYSLNVLLLVWGFHGFLLLVSCFESFYMGSYIFGTFVLWFQLVFQHVVSCHRMFRTRWPRLKRLHSPHEFLALQGRRRLKSRTCLGRPRLVYFQNKNSLLADLFIYIYIVDLWFI